MEARDIHVTLARGILVVLALVYLLLGVAMFAASVAAVMDGAGVEEALIMVLLGCFVGGMGLFFGTGFFGLGRTASWGFYVAVGAFGLLVVGGGCFPVGLYGLWAICREKVRLSYGVK